MTTLTGVGVGPGDPELVTVKGVRILREADVVVVPVMGDDVTGRAEATVSAHTDRAKIRRVVFELSERGGVTPARAAAWDAAAEAVLEAFTVGAERVAFATIGDPHVYSTFGYVAETVRATRPDVTVDTVPGVTAMQTLAMAAGGLSLCEGTEPLTLLPLTGGVDQLDVALATGGTVVAYKGGRRTAEVVERLRLLDRLDGALLGVDLGLPTQRVLPLAEAADREPYLSTIVVPARRTTRGGKL